jgi:hypothetical protein
LRISHTLHPPELSVERGPSRTPRLPDGIRSEQFLQRGLCDMFANCLSATFAWQNWHFRHSLCQTCPRAHEPLGDRFPATRASDLFVGCARSALQDGVRENACERIGGRVTPCARKARAFWLEGLRVILVQ